MLLEDKNAVLVERGADVSEVRHFESGRWVPGPDPQHRDYSSFAFFNDPEDNSRVPQEARRSELIGTVANVRAGPGSLRSEPIWRENKPHQRSNSAHDRA